MAQHGTMTRRATTGGQTATGAAGTGAVALGTVAVGALAVGALAVGAVAVGALAVGRTHTAVESGAHSPGPEPDEHGVERINDAST
jgi:hypothetical protein